MLSSIEYQIGMSAEVKRSFSADDIKTFADLSGDINPVYLDEQYAMIGTGAVVTKDVPDYAVVIGNPAKIIRYTK